MRLEYALAMKFTQPAAAREINRLRVLNLLAQNEEYSRADIARNLKLNKPSTSEIVEQLLKDGLVVETGKRETTTGRRPVAIALVPNAALVLGVDMGSRNTSIALADLKGNILRFERFPTTGQPEVKELCSQVIRILRKMAKLTTSPILGVVVALDGVIREDKRNLLRSDHWNWDDIPLAAIIEKNTDLQTLVVHNVEAMVFAERWVANEEEENFFFVNWGEHIRSTWVNKHSITGGDTQFGHLMVRSTGLCRCGKIGCLESVAAGWALSERHGGKTVKQLCQEPNKEFKEDLKQASEAMGMALVAASAITGCNKIILGGGVANIDKEYLDYLKNFYREHSNREKVAIVCSELGEKQTLLGCIAIALDSWMFKSSLLEMMPEQGQ
ncbi:MAG: ROK family transcriptional regulator [Spirochaetales bacterium]|jgi:predicted NBD/HSP70 family sugar kinase|nr:ROK family transcriptional regulator [Spirochaetales bacterium]